MAHFNYGGRIGMSTLIATVRKACDILVKYQSPLFNFINSSALSTDQKSTVIAWLNGMVGACGILMLLKVEYES